MGCYKTSQHTLAAQTSKAASAAASLRENTAAHSYSDARHSRAPLTNVEPSTAKCSPSLDRHCMAESTQGQVVHKREPNWALLVPIFYAPLFPLMRIALKGNPRLPQYYAGALGAALTHAAYMMFKDSTV